MNEEWKDIKGLEGFYQISNLGRVRRCYILKPEIRTTPKTKYKTTRILLKKKHYSVHRLVAEHFIEKPKGKTQVNHKDGNTLNNNADNLERVTPKENMQHAIETGLRKMKVPISEYDYVCEEYKKGRTTTNIAKEFGVHNTRIRDILIKKGVKIRKRGSR